MEKSTYHSRFVIKPSDIITIKGESYRVTSSDKHTAVMERELLEGGKEIITINKTCKVDREFKGSKDRLLESICKYFNISLLHLKSSGKSKFVLARRIACIILNEEGVHVEVIADAIGRDRTSVYANLKKAEDMEKYDKGLYNAYLTVKSTL